MLYIIYEEDVVNSLEKRLSLHHTYFPHLKLLQDEGRLLTAGLLPSIDSNDPDKAGFVGSVIIAEFESLESAQFWVAADPYAVSGIYNKIIVRPYKRIL